MALSMKGIGQLNLHIYIRAYARIKKTREREEEKSNILIRLSPVMWNADICRVRRKNERGTLHLMSILKIARGVRLDDRFVLK